MQETAFCILLLPLLRVEEVYRNSSGYGAHVSHWGCILPKLGTGVEENQEENVLEEVFLYLFKDSSSPREFQGEPQDQRKKMRWLQKGEISSYLCVWKIALGGSFPCFF